MFKIEGKKITMNKGDFGIELPMTISNILESDVIKFEIYGPNGNMILEKTLPYREGKFVFEITEEESNKLEEKTYMYKIVQYRENIMQNTINEDSLFKVV